MIEPDADVRHQAALWLIELQSDADNPELRARWQHWHDASPENRQAWMRIESFAGQLREMPAALAHAALAPQRSRRRALKALGLLLTAGGAGWLVMDSRQLPILLASQRTSPGERRQITLEDGSRVDLNSESALDIHFDGISRQLILHAGEIHIVTAPDPAGRPFFVDTPQGRAHALGTRFTVRSDQETEHASLVSVYAGAVAIQPRHNAGKEALILSAGQQASFTELAVMPPGPANESKAAWTRGILVAEDMPLTTFIAELARQSGRKLECDPALAHLKISGTYPLADPGRILEFLARTLPVRIQTRQHWWGTTQYRLQPA